MRNLTYDRPGYLNPGSKPRGRGSHSTVDPSPPDQLHGDLRISRRQIEQPDEHRFDCGPPCDLLHVWIAGDDSFATSNLGDRDNLTVDLHLLPRAPDTVLLVTIRDGLAVETGAMNGCHLVEWFNANGLAVFEDAKHRCSLGTRSHQQFGQRRRRHDDAALGLVDRRNQMIHSVLHVTDDRTVGRRKTRPFEGRAGTSEP